jgi:hypothetical protein
MSHLIPQTELLRKIIRAHGLQLREIALGVPQKASPKNILIIFLCPDRRSACRFSALYANAPRTSIASATSYK